jgi:membrane-associated protein
MKLAVITELIDWVRPLFATFGYVIVSAAIFFETAAFTSLVVPGDVILALGGVYAGRGDLSIGLVIACGIVFGLLGSSTGYVLGRRYGDRLLRRLPVLRRFEAKVDQAEASLQANAGKAILIGRFVTGAAGLVPFAAGASGVRPRTFFAFTVPAIVVWASAITSIGLFVGDNLQAIDRILSRIGLVGLAILVLVLGVWFWRHRGSPDRSGSG